MEERRDIFGELIVADTSDNLPIVNDMLSGLSNVATSLSMGGMGGGLPFLGLSRAGVWQYGQENIRPAAGAILALDLRTLKHGFSSWDDGKLLGEVLVPASEQLPLPSTLPQTGADWAQAVAIEGMFIDGPDDGVKVMYKTNSLGGRKAVYALIDQVKRQVQADPAKLVPMIRLKATSYQHKKYGEIFTPVFEIVRWADLRAGRANPTVAAGAGNGPQKAAPAVDDVLPDPQPQPANAGRRRRVGA